MLLMISSGGTFTPFPKCLNPEFCVQDKKLWVARNPAFFPKRQIPKPPENRVSVHSPELADMLFRRSSGYLPPFLKDARYAL